jgi:hypothetical protein
MIDKRPLRYNDSVEVRSFADVFSLHEIPDQHGKTRALDERARIAGWTVLKPGDSVRLAVGSRSIVISGVTWSKPDLVLLDELAKRDTQDVRVWFFNPDIIAPGEHVLPGAGQMVQTPALAEYRDFQLIRFIQGGAISGGVMERIRALFPAFRNAS